MPPQHTHATHTQALTHMHMYIRTNSHMYTCIYSHMQTLTHIHMHILICTRILTHILAHVHHSYVEQQGDCRLLPFITSSVLLI